MELGREYTKRETMSDYCTLPKLPYALNALEPVISEQTLKVHYGRHHKAYVDKTNKLIHGTSFEKLPLDEVIKTATGALFNNAAQVWNHTFYWNCLSPQSTDQSTEPTKGKLFDCIEHCFGSMAEFRMKFSKTGEDLFGSGCVWLVKDSHGQLEIIASKDAENPMTDGYHPVLTFDVWEHAYYLDHLNARKEYLTSVWKIVNWDFVNSRFESH